MEEEVVKLIHTHCVSLKQTLSLAESCTGGALAARITSMAGASDYFKGSIVAYSNEIKESVLGVRSTTLATYGAVSEETAKEMALSVLKLMKTDFAIAVSGIAGPTGGTVEKPVGTVTAAIAQSSADVYVWTFHFEGHRTAIIKNSVDEVLNTFWKRICRQ